MGTNASFSEGAEAFKPYANLEEGLGRLMNNKGLYSKLLKRFQTNTEAVNSIEALLTAGDTQKALEEIHAIKGTSANLSLVNIQEAAASLEADLKYVTGENKDSLFEALKESFNKTMGLLDDIIAFLEA